MNIEYPPRPPFPSNLYPQSPSFAKPFPCLRWNEPADPEGPAGPNARFKQAMSLTGGELSSYVQGLSTSWWPGRAIVAESLARRKEDHPSGEVGWAGGVRGGYVFFLGVFFTP